ncbi:GAP family protein, partial [Kitasatospora herbaricolor]|uniref:GAP family protein n=1 Tax=Kitasatospora herbaricolor TaxID=68217 RepID=UPI0036DE4AAE
LTVTVVAFILLAYVLPLSSSRAPDVVIGSLMIVIGVALIVLAVVVWRRGARSPSTGIPKWLSAVGSLGPWSAFGLALLLNIRPKAILLSIAAGLSVRGDDLTVGEATIVVIVYVVVAASTVSVPIIASLIQPDKTERRLVRTREWIATNNRIVSILILILIGVVIIGNGLARL